MESQEPRIVYQGTRLYCVTKYLSLPGGSYKAIEKFDITDQLSSTFNKMLDNAMLEYKSKKLVGNIFIVAICVNRSDIEKAMDMYRDLSASGHVVFFCDCFPKETELSELLISKIRMCDVLYVYDASGISNGMQLIIDYAAASDKQIQYLVNIDKNKIL